MITFLRLLNRGLTPAFNVPNKIIRKKNFNSIGLLLT